MFWFYFVTNEYFGSYCLQHTEASGDTKDIKYANNYAPNNHEKSYLNNPIAFMNNDINSGTYFHTII